MKKVKITREQEKWLNIHKSQEISLDRYFEDHDNWVRNYKPLSTLNQLELFLALNRWYEVEEPFQVGDWVFDKVLESKRYAKVIEIDSKIKFNDGTHCGVAYANKNLEKVTEPWKIALLELGREKPEFKIGDKYEIVDDSSYTIDHEGETFAAECHARGSVMKYFYPVESRIEVK